MTVKMEDEQNTAEKEITYEYNGVQRASVSPVVVSSVQPSRKSSKCNLVLATLACTLGSPFQIGFNTACLNTPQEIVKEFYNETYVYHHNKSISSSLLTMLWAITVAIFCLGGMIGGMASSSLMNRYGRKRVLLYNNILVFVAAAMQAGSKYVHSYELLIAGRVVIGINCGLNSAVAPTYLAEVAPTALRGFCGTCNQLAIVFGVVTSQVIGNGDLLGTTELWPLILAFSVVPAVYSLLTLSWCPESPKYLMLTKGDEQAAKNALVWLRGTTDVGYEMEAMVRDKQDMQNAKKFAVMDLWRSPSLRKPLIICLVLQMSQQLSGINAVIYYSTSIFQMASLSVSSAQLATVGSSLVNVGMTFVSALIMDRAGRRTLMLIGLIGMFASSVVLVNCLVFQSSVAALSYISVVAVIFYIIFFATGPGSIPWFIVAEMFEQGPRTAAVSLSVFTNWLSNFTVGLTYPILEKAINHYSFLPFCVLLLIFSIFTYFFAPETKGKTISEITMLFKSPDSKESASYSNENGSHLADGLSEETPLLPNK